MMRLTMALALAGSTFGMPIKEFTALLQSSQYGGGANILCDGMVDPGMYCDCDWDCTENPDWCACDDAQACCQGSGASGSGGGSGGAPPPPPAFPGSCVDYKVDNENMCSIYDSSHTCQCDSWCVDYGDCCEDREKACGDEKKAAVAMTPTQRLNRETMIKKHMGYDLATKQKELREKREAKLTLRKELSRFFNGKKVMKAAAKLAQIGSTVHKADEKGGEKGGDDPCKEDPKSKGCEEPGKTK